MYHDKVMDSKEPTLRTCTWFCHYMAYGPWLWWTHVETGSALT